MKNSDRIKRMIAFYFSIIIFFTLLPIVLSYSLGYKIDFKALKIYKTGIIYINSHPAGASIYINSKLLDNLTPTQIEELKPGTYRVEVRREGFYPWERELVVMPNMVTKADRIVLFPITKEMKRMSSREISDFIISDKNQIYYFARDGLFKSNMDGSSFKKVSSYSNWLGKIIGKKFSPDGDKFLYFSEHAIFVAYLNMEKALAQESPNVRVEEMMKAEYPIVDVFWYSQSNYIIVVTEKDIKVVELRGEDKRNIALLYKFNTKPQGVYYDNSSDSLYFVDIKREADLKEGGSLYRLDLRQTFFDKLMKMLIKKEAESGYEKR